MQLHFQTAYNEEDACTCIADMLYKMHQEKMSVQSVACAACLSHSGKTVLQFGLDPTESKLGAENKG